QDHEIAAQGKNLRRLSAQFLGADFGRGVFHARPRGCAGVGAGDVGGAGPHQRRQPIHAAQSGQAPRRPEAGPVEGYRTREAEAAGSADAARSVNQSEGIRRISCAFLIRTAGRLYIESLALPVSCPAKAGHPAITENLVVTGSPAFAGDDDGEVNDPSKIITL